MLVQGGKFINAIGWHRGAQPVLNGVDSGGRTRSGVLLKLIAHGEFCRFGWCRICFEYSLRLASFYVTFFTLRSRLENGFCCRLFAR